LEYYFKKPDTHNFKKTVQSASVCGAGELIEDNQESSCVKLGMRDTIQFMNGGRTGENVRI